jgi:cupin 2 domain-containing protein
MNTIEMENIFKNVPLSLKEELFEKIIENNNFTLERIVSEGHASPPNFWYDQEKNEFVMLLSGSATLVYDDGKSFSLMPGDYLIIPAHQKHRIEKTSGTEKTIWLALHYECFSR